MIHVTDVYKHYYVPEKEAGIVASVRAFFKPKTRTVKAVDGVSFDIAEGEMVGFLGANGAGKTTTLKMCSGLLYPSGGTISVAGFTPQRRQKEFLKSVTLVMGQKQQLLWDLPAMDSFLVNAAIYEVPETQFKATMQEFTDLLHLGDILKKQVRNLSLGERMKCELAAALLHRPKVLFLDEPTIGLDVNMQVRIREFVQAYNQRFKATVILTSHYMADVTALCKRIIVIDKGKLVFDGDLKQLIDNSSTKKIIKLFFSTPYPETELNAYGQVRNFEGLAAEILVPRGDVAKIAAQMMQNLSIADITIEDPAIEDIIGELFKGTA